MSGESIGGGVSFSDIKDKALEFSQIPRLSLFSFPKFCRLPMRSRWGSHDCCCGKQSRRIPAGSARSIPKSFTGALFASDN